MAVRESIVRAFLPPTCIAHTGATLVHDYLAIHDYWAIQDISSISLVSNDSKQKNILLMPSAATARVWEVVRTVAAPPSIDV